ncbi:UNVERIFIED_CONTAM: hypothetical protein K2H54_019754 [Gekko kuhli]
MMAQSSSHASLHQGTGHRIPCPRHMGLVHGYCCLCILGFCAKMDACECSAMMCLSHLLAIQGRPGSWAWFAVASAQEAQEVFAYKPQEYQWRWQQPPQFRCIPGTPWAFWTTVHKQHLACIRHNTVTKRKYTEHRTLKARSAFARNTFKPIPPMLSSFVD